jgi:putative Mg2+ transporter-C (MgtC) family protein
METLTEFTGYVPAYAVRLGTAFVCGILLGLERERKDKPAGLRTIVLITTGATLYMIVSELIPQITEGPTDITRIDPSRIASQVVSGIGFLGAGTIIQSRGSVHGLTTAAVIWVAAAIGLCAGIGFPLLALAITAAVLAALILMDPLRTWLSRRGRAHDLTLYVPNDSLTLQRVQYTLRQHDVRTREIDYQSETEEHIEVHFTYHGTDPAMHRLLEALSAVEGVRGIPVHEAGAA